MRLKRPEAKLSSPLRTLACPLRLSTSWTLSDKLHSGPAFRSRTAIVADTALSVPMPGGPNNQPGNADGQFLGPMTVHEALVRSRNPVAIQLGMRVGIDTIAALAQRLGITSPIAPVPSSAIGASAVRPLELVTAYTAFANLGSVVQPRLITRIEDPTGRPAYAAPPAPWTPVIDPRVACIVRHVMQGVADR